MRRISIGPDGVVISGAWLGVINAAWAVVDDPAKGAQLSLKCAHQLNVSGAVRCNQLVDQVRHWSVPFEGAASTSTRLRSGRGTLPNSRLHAMDVAVPKHEAEASARPALIELTGIWIIIGPRDAWNIDFGDLWRKLRRGRCLVHAAVPCKPRKRLIPQAGQARSRGGSPPWQASVATRLASGIAWAATRRPSGRGQAGRAGRPARRQTARPPR